MASMKKEIPIKQATLDSDDSDDFFDALDQF
jgi:hypothetical protein